MTKTIGLALGGGAARGIAHIPILEAFDELGIAPVKMAGTSMGSLVGAAYASGLSGAEIRRHTCSYLSKRTNAAKRLFRNEEGGLFDLVNFSLRKPTQIDGLHLVKLALPDGVVENIEDTKIEFSVTATDFYRLNEVTFRSGSMRAAVAASIAIPGIIEAPESDGRLVIDGAMVNPVPIDHVMDDVDIVVGIDVTGAPVEVEGKRPGYTDLLMGATQIMQANLTKLHCDKYQPDLFINMPVDRFKAYDFFKVGEILEAGDSVKEDFKRRLSWLLES